MNFVMQYLFKFISPVKHTGVTSAYIGGEVRLYDSCVNTKLAPSLMQQLKQIYQVATIASHQKCLSSNNSMILTVGYSVLHLSIALNFNTTGMRQHLVKCFEDEELLPFPQVSYSTMYCSKKFRTIRCLNFCFLLS